MPTGGFLCDSTFCEGESMTRIVIPLLTLALTAAMLFVLCSGCGSDRGLGYDVSSNKMKQIGLAIACYKQTHESFPPAVMEKDGKPLLSWRVAILPFMDEDALYKQFHLDEPWDSPHNLKLAETVPFLFQSSDSPKDGKTRIMVFTGKGAAFDGGKRLHEDEIRDGMTYTILCVQAGPDKAVPWTKPEDLPFDPENPLAALGNVPSEGFLAVFFDGHVMRLKVDSKMLKALITPDGGETIDETKFQGGQ